MNTVKSLTEIKEPNVSELGGKGYSLAILINNDFNVPKGFVIVSKTFIKFLRYNNLLEKIEKLISEIDENNLKEKNKEIKNLILSGTIPERIALEIKENLKRLNAQYVSIRSSAVSEDNLKASFAGLHDTFLNIKSEPPLVLQHIKKCWVSLFNERAVFYRMRKEIPFLEGFSVICQEMIPAEVSGIGFTVHPSYEKKLLIEASYGIGDMIVSGRVEPDDYMVDRKTLEITDKKIGRKTKMSTVEAEEIKVIEVRKELSEMQVIPDEKVKELAILCLDIEIIFNQPQDIEWCIFNDKIWLLQSRPITMPPIAIKEEAKRREAILKGLGASGGMANGPVTIILNIQQLDMVKEGDVIVTPMTTPDMVLVMGKASAIVTEVGGICCHAAMVSRELEIPCVVGTGNATSILYENMMIEVDGTRGVIFKFSEKEMIEMSERTSTTEFPIFGHKAKAVFLGMKRNKPLCPENWDYEWPSTDINRDYEWIAPRPEITMDPIGSLIGSGIEKIPYIFGFNEIGPLYIRYYNCTHYLRLDKIERVMVALKERIVNRDEAFINRYKQRLFRSYEELDDTSNKVEKEQNHFNEMDSNTLLNLYEKWWKVEDDFFAHTYLIQAIGDDIVWPEVKAILMKYFKQTDVDEYFSILSLPTVKTISIEYFKDCFDFTNKYDTIKPLIFTDLTVKETIRIISNMEEGEKWLEYLKSLTKKWGWVRTSVKSTL